MNFLAISMYGGLIMGYIFGAVTIHHVTPFRGSTVGKAGLIFLGLDIFSILQWGLSGSWLFFMILTVAQVLPDLKEIRRDFVIWYLSGGILANILTGFGHIGKEQGFDPSRIVLFYQILAALLGSIGIGLLILWGLDTVFHAHLTYGSYTKKAKHLGRAMLLSAMSFGIFYVMYTIISWILLRYANQLMIILMLIFPIYSIALFFMYRKATPVAFRGVRAPYAKEPRFGDSKSTFKPLS